MTPTQKIERRKREIRERLVAISRLEGDSYDDEIKTEERGLQDESITLDQRLETARVAEAADAEEREREAAKAGDVDAETRERIELRGKARLTNYHGRGGAGPDGPGRRARAVRGGEGRRDSAGDFRAGPARAARQRRRGRRASRDHAGAGNGRDQSRSDPPGRVRQLDRGPTRNRYAARDERHLCVSATIATSQERRRASRRRRMPTRRSPARPVR